VFRDAISDSGAGALDRGGLDARRRARAHALMRLDREIRIGGAEGVDVLPILCFPMGTTVGSRSRSRSRRSGSRA
jgi:hypothetical protein